MPTVASHAAVERNHAYRTTMLAENVIRTPTDVGAASANDANGDLNFQCVLAKIRSLNTKGNPAFHQNVPELDLLDKITHHVRQCRILEL